MPRRWIVAIAALTLAACGDPEGPTVSAPERAIEGSWLRVHDPRIPAQALTGVPAYTDTLRIFRFDGKPYAVWNRVASAATGGGEPSRSCSLASLEVDAPRLLLAVSFTAPLTLGSCPILLEGNRVLGDRAALPGAPGSQLQAGFGAPYEVLREGRDLLRVRPTVSGPARGDLTQWFRRVPSFVVVPN